MSDPAGASRPAAPTRARSLRLKLTLWFLAVFTVIQLVLLAGVAVLRRDALDDAVDAQLAEWASQMVENVLVERLDRVAGDLGRIVPAGGGIVAAAVRDDAGRVQASWRLPAGFELPFDSWESGPSAPLGPVFRDLEPELVRRLAPGEARLRQITVPFRMDDVPHALQVVVEPAGWRLRLGPILDLLLVGVPAGTIAALLAAWLIAGRAVRPVLRLSEAARIVGPETLGERLRAQTEDDEFRALEGELNAALERLEAGFRAQEEFISNVSHELKTPIAVLLTEAQVLARGADPARREAFVATVEQELRALGKLVESFLQVARAEIGRDQPFAAVGLDDLVLGSVEACERAAQDRGVPLIPALSPADQAPQVRGDAVLLRTMIDNLVRNAIRHSPRGAPVRVEAHASNGDARLVVRDLGPGIPPADQGRVFERFVQVPRSADQNGAAPKTGYGVGLSIAAQIAGLHGGRIRVSNAETGGCEFTIELPLVPAE